VTGGGFSFQIASQLRLLHYMQRPFTSASLYLDVLLDDPPRPKIDAQGAIFHRPLFKAARPDML
jgi:hypothetical protein